MFTERIGSPRRLLVVGEENACRGGLERYASELGGRIAGEAVLLLLTPDEHGHAALDSTLTTRALGRTGVLVYRAPRSQAPAAVDTLCREFKRIEFVVTDSSYALEVLSETAAVPVFHAFREAASLKGGCIMGTGTKTAAGRPLLKTALLGALSAALYALLFWKADAVMNTFTRGGVFAVLPIGAAIVFSFAHGTFAGSLWSLLGIHARASSSKQAVAPAPHPAPRPSRPRVRAYVNPFHNIAFRKD